MLAGITILPYHTYPFILFLYSKIYLCDIILLLRVKFREGKRTCRNLLLPNELLDTAEYRLTNKPIVGVSLDAQTAKIEQYAALYDLYLVDIIIDAGESAKTLDRPGLQRALSMLTSGG